MSETTSKSNFGLYGGAGTLFSVNADCDKRQAIMHAACAVNSLRALLDCAISDGREVTVSEAWLISSQLESIEGILEAVE